MNLALSIIFAAKDALAQAREGRRVARIVDHQCKAGQFERQGQWQQQAAEQYQRALTLDFSLKFAQEGKQRSKNLANLHRELDYNLPNPGRLSSKDPAASAKLLLRKLTNLESIAPQLIRKIADLKELLRLSKVRMPVQLQADGKTNVVIYKVGKFGKFLRHKLELRPGVYTVVGTCPGYRDVRRQLTVTANSSTDIDIHCEEGI